MLLLASSSPRRRDLLRQAGMAFAVCTPGEEPCGDSAAAPLELARLRAESKARGACAPADAWVLAVDTVVDLAGEEFGKPRDAAHAGAILKRLSGRCHLVYSAHALRYQGRFFAGTAAAEVEVDVLDEGDLAAHLADHRLWRGKAGGYGIQDDAGLAAGRLRVVRGEVATVVGLSLRIVQRLLDAGGYQAESAG